MLGVLSSLNRAWTILLKTLIAASSIAGGAGFAPWTAAP
jgi:hypothetical protein